MFLYPVFVYLLIIIKKNCGYETENLFTDCKFKI